MMRTRLHAEMPSRHLQNFVEMQHNDEGLLAEQLLRQGQNSSAWQPQISRAVSELSQWDTCS